MSKLVPIPVEVTAGGETFKILPFGFGMQVKAGARIAAVLTNMGVQEGDTIDFGTLMNNGADVMLDIVADAVGKPRSWLDTLGDFEEGMALAEAVWNANAETFTKKVIPAVFKKLAALSVSKTSPKPNTSAA